MTSVKRLSWITGHYILENLDDVVPRRKKKGKSGSAPGSPTSRRQSGTSVRNDSFDVLFDYDSKVLEAIFDHARSENIISLPLVARLLSHGMKKLNLSDIKHMSPEWFDVILKAWSIDELNLNNTCDLPVEAYNGLSELINLESLSVSGAKNFQDLHFLNLSDSVKALDCSYCDSLTNSALKNITDIPKLESLKLSHMSKALTQSGFLHLRRLKAQLVTLDLSFVEGLTNSSLFIINLLTSLRNLSIGYTGCTAEGLESLTDLTDLTSLNVDYVLVAGETNEISVLTTFHNLETLSCAHAAITDQLTPKLRIALSNLSTLVLEGCSNITDMGIAAIKSLDHLSELNLSKSKITDIGVNFLGQMAHLKHLKIAKSRISDLGMRKVWKISQLVSLDISYNSRITDAGLIPPEEAAAIEEMAGEDSVGATAAFENVELCWPNLTKLVCMGLAITDKAVKHISICRHQLRSLSIGPVRGSPSAITDEGLASLQALVNLDELTVSEMLLTAESLSILNCFPDTRVSLDRCKMGNAVKDLVKDMSNLTSGRDSPTLGVFDSSAGDSPAITQAQKLRRYKSLSHIVAARVARGEIAYGEALEEAYQNQDEGEGEGVDGVLDGDSSGGGLRMSRWKSVASPSAKPEVTMKEVAAEVSVFEASPLTDRKTVADHKRERARTGVGRPRTDSQSSTGSDGPSTPGPYRSALRAKSTSRSKLDSPATPSNKQRSKVSFGSGADPGPGGTGKVFKKTPKPAKKTLTRSKTAAPGTLGRGLGLGADGPGGGKKVHMASASPSPSASAAKPPTSGATPKARKMRRSQTMGAGLSAPSAEAKAKVIKGKPKAKPKSKL